MVSEGFFAYEPNKLLYMFAAETSGEMGQERMGTAFTHKKLSGNGVLTSEFFRVPYLILLYT